MESRYKSWTDCACSKAPRAGAAAGRQTCNDLIDWFVRQMVGHDAAIKAHYDSVRRFTAHPRKAG